MLGAVFGDVAGSVYEFDNCRRKDFPLLEERCFFTDDTVMTAAVAKVCLRLWDSGATDEQWVAAFTETMQDFGRRYPGRGYGKRFLGWLMSPAPEPYNSWGNGSAMRVSPVSFLARSEEECLRLARLTALPTHNHPEGVAGARCAAMAGYLARRGESMDSIRRWVAENYDPLEHTIDELRPVYRFTESCRGTVPAAVEAFLESESFEDAIRLAVSVGGDSDTLAAITGGIAEAFYGIPEEWRERLLHFLPEELRQIAEEFRERLGR